MEEEIFDLIDDIMEISHKITEHFIEIIKSDIAGKKIKKEIDGKTKKRDIDLEDIENNKIFIQFFQKLQEKYRRIERIFLEIPENAMEKDEEDDNEMMLMQPGGFPKEAKEEIQEMLFEDLKEYVRKSYMQMRFIDQYDFGGELIRESIYSRDLFRNIHEIEYLLQINVLENIQTRLKFRQEKPTLNFGEKAIVLEDFAQKLYYKNFAMRQMKCHIAQLKKAKGVLNEEEYSEMYAHLYEQKYILIYEYMQHKYNGILQENDIGKFAMINKFIDDDALSPLFNLSDFDIKANVSATVEECSERLEKTIYEIEGTEQEEEKEQDSSATTDEQDKKTTENNKKEKNEAKNEAKNEEKSFDDGK